MYVYDANTKMLQTKAVRGPRIECFAIPAERGIIGAVFTTKNGMMLKSPYEDPRFDRMIDQNRKSITRNMICVPLKSGGKCVGCIEVANKKGTMFTEWDYKLVASVSRELANGLVANQFKSVGEEMGKSKNVFKDKVGQVANENLLTPLLKGALIILAEILKCEKYFFY